MEFIETISKWGFFSDEDIGSVIENMPVTIQTMNTLKEILKLQNTEKSPNFNSETFQT